jgi:hypothetical protein
LERLEAAQRELVAPPDESSDDVRPGESGDSGSELPRGQAELPQAHEFREVQDERARGANALESEQSDPWYRPSDDVRARAESDKLVGPTPVRVELIRVMRLSGQPGDRDSQPGRSGIAIERGTLTITPEAGEAVRHLTERAEEGLGRQIEAATAQYTAQAIGDPVWRTVSQRWVDDGSAGANAAAETVADFDADLHNILLNRPVQQFSSWAGLPGPAATVLGAAELPVDRPLQAATRIILVGGGIVVGMASGHAVLASARFKSLVHDEFTRGLAWGIENTLTKRGIAREAAADQDAAGPAERPAEGRPATGWTAE